MLARIQSQEMSEVLQKAIQQRLLSDEDTSIIFYDLSRLTRKLQHLREVFPPSTLHAVAVKANPLTAILKLMNQQGVGSEAATLPELCLAEHAGFSPNRIVFDSPVRTQQELKYALNLGVHVNLDSFQELHRVAELMEQRQYTSTIGMRMNPQVGFGKIASTSLGAEYSKFGVPLRDNKERLKESFARYRWLTGVHLHIGSQSYEVETLVKGIRRVLDFVQEANEWLTHNKYENRIRIFDIGGGLPVSYKQTETDIPMEAYKTKLEEACPELFNGNFQLITEFGRYVHANIGWVASRVEYVKQESQIDTIKIHVGADLFLRKAYHPQDWHHEVTVMAPDGKIKNGQVSDYTIAGPLCFASDIIATHIPLPQVAEGDYVLIHDAGAYTLSMWSRYNSRQVPKVVGYYQNGDSFEVLKERETIEEIVAFWS